MKVGRGHVCNINAHPFGGRSNLRWISRHVAIGPRSSLDAEDPTLWRSHLKHFFFLPAALARVFALLAAQKEPKGLPAKKSRSKKTKAAPAAAARKSKAAAADDDEDLPDLV
ncbi:hypothetical protein B0H19DRAFT_1255981 [Mycena capillaripes]|nr:hypothetical protein B0H19DRAFT_1255981 [Mycena capillaripes]